MTIIKKDKLFYELLIRGNWNPANGELGVITTYQMQTGVALIDTDTGELVAPYAPDPAVDLTKDQAVEFLGDKLAGFLDQLTAERQVNAGLQAKLEAADVELQHRAATITGFLDQLTAERQVNAALQAKLEATDVELQHQVATIAALEKSILELQPAPAEIAATL